MKHRNSLIRVLFIIFLASSFLSLQADDKRTIPSSRQNPPPALVFCPKVKVVSFKATLISTQVGNPLVEFPHDTVRLEAVLENAGNANYPRGMRLEIQLKRNDEPIFKRSPFDALGAPGSRYTVSCDNSFPHGMKNTFSLFVWPEWPIPGCPNVSASASFTIDEALLHANANLPPYHK